VVQLGGALTVLLLGGFMLVMFRRDIHNAGGGDAGAVKPGTGKKVNG
jgi:hypothetical protein